MTDDAETKKMLALSDALSDAVAKAFEDATYAEAAIAIASVVTNVNTDFSTNEAFSKLVIREINSFLEQQREEQEGQTLN